MIVKVSSLSNNTLNERPNIYTVGTKGTIFFGSQTTCARQAIIQGKHLELESVFFCNRLSIALQTKGYPSNPDETNLLDSRANQILVSNFDGWYVFPSPEIFSRHSGTCIVLGDRKHSSPPREVEIGDCFRLGRE